MRFSEGRTSYLAHRIVEAWRRDGLAEVENDRLVLAEIKRVLQQEHSADSQLDATVRRKIASLSRQVPPGSREWDVLYRQYYEEAVRKTKRGA